MAEIREMILFILAIAVVTSTQLSSGMTMNLDTAVVAASQEKNTVQLLRSRGLLVSQSEEKHARTSTSRESNSTLLTHIEMKLTPPREGDSMREEAIEAVRKACKMLKETADPPPAAFDDSLHFTIQKASQNYSLPNTDNSVTLLPFPIPGEGKDDKSFELAADLLTMFAMLSKVSGNRNGIAQSRKTQLIQCTGGDNGLPRMILRMEKLVTSFDDAGHIYRIVHGGKFTKDGETFVYYQLPDVIISESGRVFPIDYCPERVDYLSYANGYGVCTTSGSPCSPLNFTGCPTTTVDAISETFTYSRPLLLEGMQLIATRLQSFIIRDMSPNGRNKTEEIVAVPPGGVFTLQCPETSDALFGSRVVHCIGPRNVKNQVTAVTTEAVPLQLINEEEGSGFDANSISTE